MGLHALVKVARKFEIFVARVLKALFKSECVSESPTNDINGAFLFFHPARSKWKIHNRAQSIRASSSSPLERLHYLKHVNDLLTNLIPLHLQFQR